MRLIGSEESIMSQEVKAWKCDKCGKAWLNKQFADDCCKEKPKEEYKCRVCGCETKPPWGICQLCREKERFEKAKKVKYSEYKIDCLYDETTGKYYADKEELEEDYFNDATDYGDEAKYPEWVYGCVVISFRIDIENALERASEDMYEDFDVEKSVVNHKELIDFVKAWNEKQTAKAYSSDYHTAVLLNE